MGCQKPMNRTASATSDKDDLHALWEAAVAAALPDGKFAGRLPARPKGRTLVLGAGKASARMAAAFEDAWGPCEGLVVTRYGHGHPTRFVEVAEAAHPVPDAAGLDASTRILELARSATADDLVVFLISGGASALLVRPADGLTLAEKQAVNVALLRSGAPIDAMNEVRRCISGIKGGQLAVAAAPAAMVTYLISDVPGDDPAVIGSGPTVVGSASPERALAVLASYGIPISPNLRKRDQGEWGAGGIVEVDRPRPHARDAADGASGGRGGGSGSGTGAFDPR